LETSTSGQFHGKIHNDYKKYKKCSALKKSYKLTGAYFQGAILHGKNAWKNGKINKMFVGAHIPYDVESCRMVGILFLHFLIQTCGFFKKTFL
jgi:hypothetical protein